MTAGLVAGRKSHILNRESEAAKTGWVAEAPLWSPSLDAFALSFVSLVFLVFVSFCATSSRAWSAEAAPAAEDPELEKRVTELSAELRCLVCQNQTIADSNADLAIDLRNQVREQLKRGATNEQIIDYMVERYGDFVLYRPPVKTTTLLLWVGPFLLLVIGLGALFYRLSRRPAAPPAELTAAERARAAALLAQKDAGEQG